MVGLDPAKLAGPRGLGAGFEESGSPEPLVHAYAGHDSILVLFLNNLRDFRKRPVGPIGLSSAKLFGHDQAQTDRARYHLMLMLVDARGKASSCSGPAFGAGF